MTSHENVLLILVICFILVIPVHAVPTIGAATDITSNNATFTIAGSSGETFVKYGQYSNGEVWREGNYTSPASITIWGAPLLGGVKYYAKACDATGCGNEVSWTMAAVTPVPTQNYDIAFNGLVSSHWSLSTIGAWLFLAYTRNVPAVAVWILLLGCIAAGYWRQTKSTRLVSILLMILGPLIMHPDNGLYLGMPGVMQALGAVLFAIGFAGTILSFIKK